jgi:hypothetical protein
MLHVLVAEEGALKFIKNAAHSGSFINWIVPKSAAPDDNAVLFYRPQGFLGTARIISKPQHAMFGRKRAYRSNVGKVALFPKPIPLEAVADQFPKWAWLTYPRSLTSVSSPFSHDLLRFLTLSDAGTVQEQAVIEGIAREIRVSRLSRSRKLRQEALLRAAGVCNACGVNYSEVLNGLGECVLQVHHLDQLSLKKIPSLTRLRKLAVLCANCHAIIHSNPNFTMSIITPAIKYA